MGERKKLVSKTVEWIKGRALLVVAFLTIGSLFFPYSVLNGLHLGEFAIRLDAYRDLGSFLSGVTALITVALVYLAYSKQSNETAIAEQQLAISRLGAYESEISEAIARKQGVLARVSISERSGDAAIDNVVEALNSKLRGKTIRPEPRLTKNDLIRYYENEFQKSTLSVYHRYMYWLIKRIHSNPSLSHMGADGQNLKRELVMRMRAEMSIGELVLSLMNSCTTLGSGSYARLCSDYYLHDQLLDKDFLPVGYTDLVHLLFDIDPNLPTPSDGEETLG